MTCQEPRIGELFAGYGGLGMGVQAVLGGEVAWYSEIDKGALKILTHRFPDVPNIGDITTVDWSTVPPVDILTGGSPCQDLSHAGKRAGMTEGTRSNLWVAMREAIAQLRPPMVVWENVRGAYSAEADSDLVTDPRLLADTRRRDGEPVLRALGRVLGDISDLGYVGGWHGLRAADVGAPHGRFRVFVVAYADGGLDLTRRTRSDQRPVPHSDGRGSASALLPTPRVGGQGANASELRRNTPNLETTLVTGLLPTPRATDGTKGGPNQRGSSGDLMLPSAAASLLPTPTARDFKNAGDPSKTAGRMAERGQPLTEHGNGNGNGKSLSIGGARSDEPLLNGQAKAMHEGQWGEYAAAIHRWESLTRPAPVPTMLSTKGNPQLSLEFVEWLMGLSAGWVTDAPGITRNEALKALGNGVVPQQAEAAVRFLMSAMVRNLPRTS